MSQITTRLPDALVAELDEATSRLKCSRVEIIRQAIESYLEEFDDLSVVIKRLRDPSDPALNWGIRSDVSFSTRIKRSVANKLERIANLNRARIVEGIDRLANNPFLGNALDGRVTEPATTSCRKRNVSLIFRIISLRSPVCTVKFITIYSD